MSVLLQDQVISFIRSTFTQAEVNAVLPYAGEFNAEEVGQLSFTCPAILVAVLGWKPENKSTRLVGRHVRRCRVVAFIVTKHTQRDARMRQAALLAERLALVLRNWAPGAADSAAIEVAALEDEPTCENLYGRTIDSKGLALWQVDWQQCIRPIVTPAQLFDLLAVDITDYTHQGAAPAADTPLTLVPLAVTEDVLYVPLTP